MAKPCETNDKNGLNNAISNVPLRKPSYQSPFVRRKQQQQQQILSQIKQYQNSDSSAGTSTARRESIVKPTWQNVCPGEVPHETLDRLNQLSNGEQITILFNQQQNRLMNDSIDQNSGKHPTISRKPAINNNHITRTTSGGPENECSRYDGKVMLLGDSGVGKTCLLVRFRDGKFLSGNYITTVGIDFRTKIVELENTSVRLQIWDTAGQERFRSISTAYYRDAHALLLLYDVTKKTSFDNIRAWLGEIREYSKENVIIMLLGNKADCPDRQVAREDGERLAREYDVAFMETSAKTGLNVDLAFQAVARKLKSRKADSVDEARFNVQDYVNEKSSKVPSCSQCIHFGGARGLGNEE